MGNESSKSKNLNNNSVVAAVGSSSSGGSVGYKKKTKTKSTTTSCLCLDNKKGRGHNTYSGDVYTAAHSNQNKIIDEGGFEESRSAKPNTNSSSSKHKVAGWPKKFIVSNSSLKESKSLSQKDSGAGVRVNASGAAAATVTETVPETLVSSTIMEEKSKFSGPSRPLQKNDRVVWVGEVRPELGSLKWQGRVNGVYCAGIELKNKRTVSYLGERGSKRFSCKPGHRALVPMDEVKLYIDYVEEESQQSERIGPAGPTSSGVVVMQAPIKIESRADKQERRNAPPQDINWNKGDIILFRDTHEKAEILDRYLGESDNNLWVKFEYIHGSSMAGKIKLKKLLDVMAKADVIRPSGRNSSNIDHLVAENITVASIHSAERSFTTDEQAEKHFLFEEHSGSKGGVSQNILSGSPKALREKSFEEGTRPPHSILTQPPQRLHTVHHVSPHSQPHISPRLTRHISPLTAPHSFPPFKPQVSTYSTSHTSPQSTSHIFPHPPLHISPSHPPREPDEPMKSSSMQQTPLNGKGRFDKEKDGISPEQIFPQLEMKKRHNKFESSMFPPKNIISSISAPCLKRSSSNREDCTGYDEVDISFATIGFNRDEELKYFKGWTPTHRQSQKQAAGKGVEAIIKSQLKAASIKASDRESAILDLKTNKHIQPIRLPKSEDISKHSTLDINSVRRPSQTDSLESPALVKIVQSSLSGSDASLNEKISGLDKAAAIHRVSETSGTDFSKPGKLTNDEGRVSGDNSVGLIISNEPTEIFQSSNTVITSPIVARSSKRAKLTRQKPYPEPGIEVTSVLFAEKIENEQARIQEFGSTVPEQAVTYRFHNRQTNPEILTEVVTNITNSQISSDILMSEFPRNFEIQSDNMDVDVGVSDDNELGTRPPGLSQSEILMRPESGHLLGPERTASLKRARTAPYSDPGLRQKSSIVKPDQRVDIINSPSSSAIATQKAHRDETVRTGTTTSTDTGVTITAANIAITEVVNSEKAKAPAETIPLDKHQKHTTFSPNLFDNEKPPHLQPTTELLEKNEQYSLNNLELVRKKFPNAEIIFHPAVRSSASASTSNQGRSHSEEGYRSRSFPPKLYSSEQNHNHSLPDGGQYDSTSKYPSTLKATADTLEIGEIPGGLKVNDRVIWFNKSDEAQKGMVLRLFSKGSGVYVAVVRFDNFDKRNFEELNSKGHNEYEVPVMQLVSERTFVVLVPSSLEYREAEKQSPNFVTGKLNDNLDEIESSSSLSGSRSPRRNIKKTSTGVYPPFTVNDIGFGECIGTKKGIQGQFNSCYLDVTLFSMFYFIDIFDDLLLASRNTDSNLSAQVKRSLRRIVNRLRSKGYCSANHVMEFRNAMQPVCNKISGSFMDVEDLMFKMFDDALKLPYFIHYSTDVSDHMTQILIDNNDKKKCRTIQDLLETSFKIQENLKFKSVPKPALILEMPRSNGTLVHYNAIIPNMILHIGNVIEEGVISKSCLCDDIAVWECQNCVLAHREQSAAAYCDNCRNTLMNEIHKELNHDLKLVRVNATALELLAVICFRSAHYVTFVKSGTGPDSPWLFFDSMAGSSSKVELVPDINLWLKGLEQNPDLFKEKSMPPLVRRLITDNHICIYYSPSA